ncbi:hypothetical protein DUI87_17495 [Hirundo rustica rustica]|uniref:Serine/arginine repetitive matrix protein C-terminal domain-containing protein n=1 Tax=Hirundo rustica rustica TaxID=333673 RepID=A0A3M0K4C6_HIRRU|nr:hypothetical protein DUI87_17495 [Hirundo rustica rustica]
MAGVQQGEKQLFEKFWRGTFKAVATPRPESIIVASITARKPLPSGTLSCLPYPAEDRRPEKLSSCVVREPAGANGCAKGRDRRDHGHRRSRSPSCDEERPLPARGKKKKKKSGRKKRRRSPQPLSTLEMLLVGGVRTGVARMAVSSLVVPNASLPSQVSLLQPFTCEEEKEEKLQEAKKKQVIVKEEKAQLSWAHPEIPSASALPLSLRELRLPLPQLPEQISQSGSSADLFTKTDSPPGNLASQNGEYHEYDSGNDTSSPPSTQTSSSRSKDSQEKRSLVHDGFGHAFSSGKPKLANSDNSSDSGNSFTSCFSQTKGTALENLSPDAQGQDRSARKRPIPYYRPSPSSSSSAGSYSSWYSSSSRSPSRSRSYSSYRTSRSRSRSWSSSRSSGPRSSRSRSRSYDSGASSDSLRR